MKIASLQLNFKVGDLQGNVQKIVDAVLTQEAKQELQAIDRPNQEEDGVFSFDVAAIAAKQEDDEGDTAGF